MSETKQLINELLVDIFNVILSIESNSLRENGSKLSITEVHTLEAIQSAEDKTMSNVAKTLMITVGTLTTAIDKLVKKGYVIRNSSENDRRKVILGLTQKSKDELKIHRQFHETMLDAVLTDMKIEENETLVEALRNLSNYFKDLHNKIS